MSAAISAMFSLWGWIGGGIRKLFKRERRRKVAIAFELRGSVLRKVIARFEVIGTVLRNVERQVQLVGENFTAAVFDLLMEDDD